MVKPASFDSKGMKKGAWSEDEDNKLRDYVLRYGHWNWRLLPKYAGLARCGKSCRLRWVNYLKPGVKKGNFTKEEEELIVKLQGELGNKWSTIATKFPGRTDSEIKNFWYRRIEKRCNKRKPETKPKPDTNNQETFRAVSEKDKHIEFSNISTIEPWTSPINVSENHQDFTYSISDNTSSGSLMHEPTQPDFWADSLSFSENEYFPPLPGEELFYEQLHYDNLTNSNSSLLNDALEWIAAADDQSMGSSSSLAEPVQEDVSSEPFSWDGFLDNALSEDNYFDPTFQYFDYTGYDRVEENVENLWDFN